MKKLIFSISITAVLLSCAGKENIPDVSSIKINIETKRFEQDFFALDTVNISESLNSILEKYPDFLPDFIDKILGLDLDSLLISGNSQGEILRSFLHDYRPIKDSADLLYKNFNRETDAIVNGLQFVKHYFPKYKIPEFIITFIGPINASFATSFGIQGDVITPKSFAIGLQLHLGKYFSFYRSPQGLALYPDYLSNNFDAAHIPINCMKNVVDDLFPEKSIGKALVEQMVAKGRRIYLLTKFLPHTPEYECMGYTKQQMENSYKNEAVIWDFFLNNDLLNISDQNIVKNYIGESPKTQELGEDAPGNLGTFAGLQIVKKYMEKNPETSLGHLMTMDERSIYNGSKYKPRP